MRRHWLSKLLALALAVTPAAAQEIGTGGGFVLDSQNQRPQNETVALSRATCVTSTSNATTYNFTPAVPAGSSATDTGLIVVVAMGEDNATVFNVSNVVIGGVAATEVVDEDGTGVVEQGWSAATAVDVTFSEALAGSATVCVWMLKNLQSLTPTSSVQDDDTASGALVLTTGTTTSGGFVVGGCITQDTSVTTTWAVLSEREDADNGEHDYSNADAAATGASMSNTCDWSSTGDASGVAAAFR
jgi:hypothetical protein